MDISNLAAWDRFAQSGKVEDYLQYLAYLEKWDGVLPEVVAGDDAISIIVPNND